MPPDAEQERFPRHSRTSAASPPTHLSAATSGVAASSVEEVDGYEAAIEGVRIEAVRTGRGSSPNSVLTARGGDLTLTAARIGFPILTSTTIDDDTVIVARIFSAPRGSRWCELDLHPGAVILFSPGAEHTGVNHSGLAFAFATTRSEVLAELADRLEFDFRPPPRGEVRELPPGSLTERIGSALNTLASDASRGVPPWESCDDDLVRLVATALSPESPASRASTTARSGIDNGAVVHACLGYAESIGHRPTIRDLCSAAGVSERRLYTAFEDTLGKSPGRFFRAWGLDRARRALLESQPRSGWVTSVASDLGFGHLGRFAEYYKEAFGELPSQTLSRRPTRQPALRR